MLTTDIGKVIRIRVSGMKAIRLRCRQTDTRCHAIFHYSEEKVVPVGLFRKKILAKMIRMISQIPHQQILQIKTIPPNTLNPFVIIRKTAQKHDTYSYISGYI